MHLVLPILEGPQTVHVGNSSCWTIHIWLTPYIPPNQTTGMLVLSMSARLLSVLAIYDSHRMMGQ